MTIRVMIAVWLALAAISIAPLTVGSSSTASR